MTQQPVFTNLTEQISQVARDLRPALSVADQQLFDDTLGDFTDLNETIGIADDHDSFCDAVRDWGHKLGELAEIVLAPETAVGTIVEDKIANLLVSVVRTKYPRLAAVLAIGGVIVDDPMRGPHFDFDGLAAFVSDPPALIDETFWDELFQSQDTEGTGRAPAMLLALLLLAPDTISALGRGQTRITALEPPPVSDSAAPQWRTLRERSAGWIPITFPLVTGDDDRLGLPVLSELRGDFAAELALSVLIRSQRREVAGRMVTDFELWLHPSVDAPHHEFRADGGGFLRLEPGVRSGIGYDGGTGTWNAAVRSRGAPANEAVLSAGREAPENEPDILVGAPYDTRLVVRDIGASLTFRESGEPHADAEFHVDGFAVVYTNRWLRSLGEADTSLREGLRFELDLSARIADGHGFSLHAEGGLSTTWHLAKAKVSLKVLTLQIHSISVFARVRGTEAHLDARAEVRAHFSVTVGPLVLVLDGAGGWAGWWADDPGGDKHCVGLLPPTGAGIQLTVRGVTVGGFLDFTGGPSEHYGGVVTVQIGPPRGTAGFGVTGFGVHELLGSPDDDVRRRSIVVVLGVTFRPGWQLGWGLRLDGLGGIIGINRRADTDALRERLTSGAVSNILFADDPIRNAPVLLGDIDAIFPPKQDATVIGITVQMGWLGIFPDQSFVRLGLGVIVEVSKTPKVVIIGSAQVRVPHFESILSLEIDVIGVVDLVHSTFELDATILRGRLLGLFVITGDAAIRSSWGDQPYLMATIGGFHPDFHPQPAVFPKLTRFRLALEHQDRLPKALSLAGEGYLAVTTNTVQAGLELIATISAGNWNIQGKIGGDVLVQLPFFFDLSLHGSVAVRWKSHSIAAVKLKGGLRGVSPLVLYGEVCLEFLFFDVCYSGSWELGATEWAAAGVTTLLPVIVLELEKSGNLSVSESTDPLVQLEFDQGGPRPVFGVLGTVTWQQHRVPFDTTVTQFESGALASPQRFAISGAGTAPFLDWFSPGQFVQLTEAEQLALPSFERRPSGVTVALGETMAAPVVVDVEIEEIRIPEPPRRGLGLGLHEHLLLQLAGRDAAMSVPSSDPPRFSVRDDAFVLPDGAFTSATEAHVRVGAHAHHADVLVAL